MGFKNTRSAVAAGVAVVAAVVAIGGGMALAAGHHAAGAVTISVKHTSLGPTLVAGPRKLTVYLFTKDHGIKSACDTNSGCSAIWPAVKTTSTPKAGIGVNANQLGEAKEGKFEQATYHGHLLYYFASDKRSGQVLGQLIDAKGTHSGSPVWFAVSPKGLKITKNPATTGTGTSPASGGGGGSSWG